MITRDHETIVIPDQALDGLIWAFRCAVSALRRAGSERAAAEAEERLALYTDWIYGDQPKFQAEFFARYFDRIFDPIRIEALIKNEIADQLQLIIKKSDELDAGENRRAEWIAHHPDQIR